jgi:hypothetical protein
LEVIFRRRVRYCLLSAGSFFLSLAALGQPVKTLADADLPAFAHQIERACPSDGTEVILARDHCSAELGKVTLMDQVTINRTIRWGGHNQSDYVPAHNTLTSLDTLVWRKLYLSLFEFSGKDSVVILPDESRLLLMDARLRALPDSEYPYPFWHSTNKWHAYQQTTQIALLFKGGKLLAGYRDALSKDLKTTDHTWSGFWTTDDQGKLLPKTALFNYLLSKDNPELVPLEQAYKALANEGRKYQCAECHTPANVTNMNPLLILNLPSQALSGRHEIVYQISKNKMPPGRGISNDADRQRLLRLARQFESMGDLALRYEQENTTHLTPEHRDHSSKSQPSENPYP